MNKIKRIFENRRKIFIAYIVCGDPDIDTTLALMKVLAESGVDIIELGMPFTDPIADGPVIQKSVERSLKNNTSLKEEALKTGLIREKEYDKIVDPKKMIYPSSK